MVVAAEELSPSAAQPLLASPVVAVSRPEAPVRDQGPPASQHGAAAAAPVQSSSAAAASQPLPVWPAHDEGRPAWELALPGVLEAMAGGPAREQQPASHATKQPAAAAVRKQRRRGASVHAAHGGVSRRERERGPAGASSRPLPLAPDARSGRLSLVRPLEACLLIPNSAHRPMLFCTRRQPYCGHNARPCAH
jgi:hypothetical protein